MLHKYFHRLYDSINSRGYIEIERLSFDELPDHQGIIEGRLEFHDGSFLEFDEAILYQKEELIKIRYAYHYQAKSGELIFRYDNAPHYPNIETYPHHKHVGSKVEPATMPDLSDILREIDETLFENQ